jgi:hypothetical protein
MVDKIGKFARCQLEQFTPVHLKETTRREPLGLPVEINSRAAGGELTGLIALVMGFKTAGTNVARLVRFRTRQHGGRRAIPEQSRRGGIAMPWQGARRDFRGNDEHALIATGGDHRCGDIEA